MGRPNVVVKVSPAEREQLDSIVHSRSLPHSLVRPAGIIEMSADGVSNGDIAQRCGVSDFFPIHHRHYTFLNSRGLVFLIRTKESAARFGKQFLRAILNISGGNYPLVVHIHRFQSLANLLQRG